MKHELSITVTGEETPVIECKKTGIREKLLHFLLGDIRKVTLLVMGDTVSEVFIKEVGDDRVT